jgi:putative dimethyl sulfoxide reductase chaperone
MIIKLESRTTLYSALALAFAYPAEPAVWPLLAEEMSSAVDRLNGRAELATAVAHVRTLITDLNSPAAADLPGPAEEHTFLFARQTPCPIYESAYYAGGMEQNMADIAAFYRAFGLQIAPEAYERCDHISSQLEFMAVLCAKEAHALRNNLAEPAEICRDARRTFLEFHLGRWTPAFAARLQTKARLPLYPALAEVLLALLSDEAKEVGVTLGPPIVLPLQQPGLVEDECPAAEMSATE